MKSVALLIVPVYSHSHQEFHSYLIVQLVFRISCKAAQLIRTRHDGFHNLRCILESYSSNVKRAVVAYSSRG
jgi:hypothetical protein